VALASHQKPQSISFHPEFLSDSDGDSLLMTGSHHQLLKIFLPIGLSSALSFRTKRSWSQAVAMIPRSEKSPRHFADDE
jgi:hypothetical protein